MKPRPLIVIALVGVLALGGAAIAVTTRRPRQEQVTQPTTLPAAADPSLPPVQVGAATGYASSVIVGTGPVDYSYVGDGWLYHVLKGA